MKPRKRKFSADGEILDLWRRLVDAELVKRRSALPEQVNQTLEKFVAMGNPDSGGAYKCVRADCDSEIDTRVGIVLSSLKRAHQAVGSPLITEALGKKLKDEAGHYVEAIVGDVSEFMAKGRPSLQLPESLFDFKDTECEAKKRIDVELDLYFNSVGEAKKAAETGRDITHAEKERSKCQRICRVVKKVAGWICALVGFLAALLTILYYLGWL